MNAERLLTHFDRIANTHDAIPRLRQFILDLAVRGKLVPQDPNDEPASELLKRIATEKTRLVMTGEIKKSKSLLPVDTANAPFVLSVGWTWARFPEIGIFGRGKSKHRPRNDSVLYKDGKYPFIQTGDVARSSGSIETYSSLYNDIGLAQSAMWPAGTLCITIAANIADSGILTFDACFPDSIVGLIVHTSFDDARFFEYFLRTAKGDLHEFAPSTAQKNINLGILMEVLIPLPPLAEQHRIVAKVDELMVLCDQLEAKQAKREATRTKLASASLAHLNVPNPDQATFQKHTAFALNNLTPLTTRPDQIKTLRQTILNLAVRGKLVPQDPNDEPASALLKRILTEKARLVKAGAIKKTSVLDELTEDEKIFEMPKGWNWVRLGNIATYMQRGRSPKYATGTNVVVVSQKCVQWHGLDLSVAKEIDAASLQDYEEYRFLRDEDLLWNSTGTGTIGRVVRVTCPSEKLVCDSHVTLIRCPHVVSEYIRIWLRSDHVYGVIEDRAAGSTNQVELTSGLALGWQVPLPPLAEQRRIVAKVDELMALCDQLEASLVTDNDTRACLRDALLHEALEPAGIAGNGSESRPEAL